MKKLLWLLVVLLVIVCVAAWFRPYEPLPAEIRTETKIQTVVKTDTVLISAPIAVFLTFTNDTIHIGDTVVMREQAYYEDSLYRAWVSGYRPKLDSIEVYPKTIYQTVTNDIYHAVKSKKKRWGLGLQAGYGYPGVFYMGVGVSYNLFMW